MYFTTSSLAAMSSLLYFISVTNKRCVKSHSTINEIGKIFDECGNIGITVKRAVTTGSQRFISALARHYRVLSKRFQKQIFPSKSL
jgi:hypothetical protein